MGYASAEGDRVGRGGGLEGRKGGGGGMVVALPAL